MTENRFLRQLGIATNWPVLVAVLVLSSLGVVSIWADERSDAIKQIVFMGVGLSFMMLFQTINYQTLGRYAWGFYFFSMGLILYTVVGGIADAHHVALPGVHPIKGQCNWITFRFSSTLSFGLQPSELTKIGFVGVMARYLRFRSNYRTLAGLMMPFGLAVIPLVLILKQPDLGTALVFIPALFAMLFIAGAKMRHLLAIVALGAALAPVAWLSGKDDHGVAHSHIPGLKYLPELVKNYQRERVYSMFSDDPHTAQHAGYQQGHSVIAFGSGGLLGKGAGQIPIGRSVPEAHNDMVFALIGEQFGFLGAAAVLGSYLVLFAAGVEISAGTREPFGRLVAAGVVSMLAGQTFMNLMVATRLMPVTGLTLPFVSYGGSSLLASFMAVGLLLNIGQNRPLVMAKTAFGFGEEEE